MNASLNSSNQHKLFIDTQMNLPNLVHKTSATLLGVATLVLGADLVHAMTKEALVGKAPVCHGENLLTIAHHARLLFVVVESCNVFTHAHVQVLEVLTSYMVQPSNAPEGKSLAEQQPPRQ